MTHREKTDDPTFCLLSEAPGRRANQLRGIIRHQDPEVRDSARRSQNAGVFAGLAIVAFLTVFAFDDRNAPSPAAMGANPEKPVTAEALLPALRDDAAGYEAALKGKRLRVVGRVRGVRSRGQGGADLLLASGDGAVVFKFADAGMVSALHERDTVTAEGVCDGLDGGREVVLSDAAIRRVHSWQDRERGRPALAAETERSRRERLRVRTRAVTLLRKDGRFLDTGPFTATLEEGDNPDAFDFTIHYARPQAGAAGVEEHARALIGYCLEALREQSPVAAGKSGKTVVASHDRRDPGSGTVTEVYGAAIYDARNACVEYVR